jgi:SAM-dependent methyltransferase
VVSLHHINQCLELPGSGGKELTAKESAELEKRFYERLWESSSTELSSEEHDRLAITVASVPEDCRSVLDVGCGDGRVSQLLRRVREGLLVAFDLSLAALRRFPPPGCCGSAEFLPFADRVFDLVMATEIMEHLPQAVYVCALQEMARVAQRYILVTVPNNENLNENIAVCPACGSRFHVWGHRRTYTSTELAKVFSGFRIARIFSFGSKIATYNRCLLWVRMRLAGACCWEEQTVCYACGSARRPEPRWPLLARGCDSLNYRFWGRVFQRSSWLLALFEREF